MQRSVSGCRLSLGSVLLPWPVLCQIKQGNWDCTCIAKGMLHLKVKVRPKGHMVSSLTSDQPSYAHCGGQGLVLHLSLDLGRCVKQCLWSSTSVSVWSTLRTHSTVRVCTPPPHVWLHLLHLSFCPSATAAVKINQKVFMVSVSYQYLHNSQDFGDSSSSTYSAGQDCTLQYLTRSLGFTAGSQYLFLTGVWSSLRMQIAMEPLMPAREPGCVCVAGGYNVQMQWKHCQNLLMSFVGHVLVYMKTSRCLHTFSTRHCALRPGCVLVEEFTTVLTVVGNGQIVLVSDPFVYFLQQDLQKKNRMTDISRANLLPNLRCEPRQGCPLTDHEHHLLWRWSQGCNGFQSLCWTDIAKHSVRHMELAWPVYGPGTIDVVLVSDRPQCCKDEHSLHLAALHMVDFDTCIDPWLCYLYSTHCTSCSRVTVWGHYYVGYKTWVFLTKPTANSIQSRGHTKIVPWRGWLADLNVYSSLRDPHHLLVGCIEFT